MINRIFKFEKKKKSETLFLIREGCYSYIGNNKELVVGLVHVELDLRSPRNTLYLLLFLRNSIISGKLQRTLKREAH